VGQIVPLAKEGATVSGGHKIKRSKIRGIESNGMICSAAELGLESESSGILILDEDRHALGSPFIPARPDTVLGFEITPNRPDLLSMLGVARLVSAVFGLPLKPVPRPACPSDPSLDINSLIKIENTDTGRCPRYTAAVISGVTVKESPAWLKERLTYLGIRPINNVVDATNYVMLEQNQPLHAFDHKKLRDKTIKIRTASDGESITALDGKTYKLKNTDLVIADSSNPVAIAGVMGGEHYSIDASTDTIVLESAFFSPKTVRKTSRSLGLSSDSSYRFERGIDIENTAAALNRAAALIIETGGGKASPSIIDIYPEKYKAPGVFVRFERVNSLLGTSFSPEETKDFIKKLNFSVSGADNTGFTASVPSYRTDISLEADIIEDIGQVYGYDNIPSTIPSAPVTLGSESAAASFISSARARTASFGFSEVMNYSFLNDRLLKSLGAQDYAPENPAPIKNPFNDEESRMKDSLIPDLIKNLVFNKNNENENIHLFEAASVFSHKDGAYSQLPYLAGISCGHIINPSYASKGFVSDIAYIKALINSVIRLADASASPSYRPVPNRPFYEYCAGIYAGSVFLGYAGQVKEEILYDAKITEKAFMFELSISALLALKRSAFEFRPISPYPVVKRDLSIIIDSSVPSADVESAILAAAPGLISSIKLFDLYKGSQVPESMKSLSYSIIFRSSEKTLSDAEINRAMESIISALESSVKAKLRS